MDRDLEWFEGRASLYRIMVRENQWQATRAQAAIAHFAGLAQEFEDEADLLRLAGLDLSDLYAPTPGDAVALRGGVLAGERWRPLADGFASAVDAAREVGP